MKPLSPVYGVYYGTDPECFFQKDGAIIGSEKVLGTKPLLVRSWGGSKIVNDGVQFELNPEAASSPLYLARNISAAMAALKRHLAGLPEVSCCYKGVIEVSREELDSLSEGSRILGCKPSLNYYGEKPITVDAKEYLKRSAAGHAHFGLDSTPIYNKNEGQDDRERLVPLLDILVGNTCVLLDRDPGAAERRENYGRAGEYRLPPHGLEYRTLSNFWLRSYSLMSLVFGLGNMALSILARSLYEQNSLEQKLAEMVDIDKVIEAIDTNNYDLAKANFETIKPFLLKVLPASNVFQLGPGNINKFLNFTDAALEKGLESFFPDDPLTHWATLGYYPEFHMFLAKV